MQQAPDRARRAQMDQSWEVLSLIAKRDDGVEPGSLACRPDAEHDPHKDAEADGREDRQRAEDETPAGERADQGGDGQADDDPEQASGQRKRERLDQELGEDVAPARADRLADPDLAG